MLPPKGFTWLSDVDPSIMQEMRYYTAHNFMGRRVEGYNAPGDACILTVDAAQALKEVQSAALSAGYSLKMYDCYRPQRAVDDFVMWADNSLDMLMAAEFYPDLGASGQSKSEYLFPDYIAYQSGHTRGSTMDLTIVPLKGGAGSYDPTLPTKQQVEPPTPYLPGQPLASCYAPLPPTNSSAVDGTFRRQGGGVTVAEEPWRYGDNSLDMGTGFDCLAPVAHTETDSTVVTEEQRANRSVLLGLMQAEGRFYNYAGEWWHYTLTDEPFPDTYFNFPIQRNDDCSPVRRR